MAYGDVEQSFSFRFSDTQDFRFPSGGSLYGFWVDANNFYISGTNRTPRTTSVKKMIEVPIPGSSASGTISTTITDSVTVDQPDAVGFWADATNLYVYGGFVGPSPSFTFYRRVWKYRLSDLTYVSRFDFSNLPTNYGWFSEHGFWSDGTTFWGLVRIPNTTTAKAYAWNASGNRVTSKDVTFTNPWASFGEAKDSHRVQGFFATSDKWYLLLSEWESGQSYKARIVPFLKSNVNVVENDIIIFPAGENVREVRLDSTGNFLWTLSANGSFDAKFQKISFERVATPTAPGTPTGLVATVGDMTVTLKWGVVSTATAYSVEYRTGTSGSWTLHSDSIVVNGATITGLTNSQAYQFRVRAENSGGESGWSTAISATPSSASTDTPEVISPPETPPAIPANLGGVVGTNGDVYVTWTEAPRAAHYNLRLRVLNAQSWNVITNVADENYTFSGLQDNAKYQIAVQARNAFGVSDWSEPIQVTADVAAPSLNAPTGLTARAGNGFAEITFDIREEIPEYQVRVRKVGGSWREVVTYFPTDYPFIVDGLDNETSYQIQLREDNLASTSNWTSSVTVKPTQGLSGKPEAIQDFSGIGGNAHVEFSWYDPNGGGQIQIQGRLRGSTSWSLTVSGSTARSIYPPFFEDGLKNGQWYEFRARAWNKHGTSGWSPIVDVLPNSVYARIKKPVTKERMIIVHLANSDYGICSGSEEITLANNTRFGIFKNRKYLPWIQTSEEAVSESVHQTSASNPSINLSIPVDESVQWIRDRKIGEEISIAYLERTSETNTWELTEYGVLGLIEELSQDSSGFSFSLISLLERFTKRDVKRWSDHAHQTEYEGDLWFSKLNELSVRGEYVILVDEEDD